MKKLLKGICVLSLLVLFSAAANAAGMIKDYHAYRIKNQNIRTVVPVVDDILSKEVEVKKLARDAYYATYGDEHYYMKFYPALHDTDVYIVTDATYDKDNKSKVETYIPEKKNEGFKTASKVNYVARCGNFKTAGLPYKGSLKVLKIIMAYEYMWLNIRVKGGAYGCSSGFDRNGDTYFVSYRDPHLKETDDIYEKIPEYLENFDPDDRDMTKYIIGTFSSMDTPLNPSAKGARSRAIYYNGITEERLQRERDEVLGTTRESIRALAPYIRAVLSDECTCVIGDENAVEKNGSMFDSIRSLQ